jgi:putative transposase
MNSRDYKEFSAGSYYHVFNRGVNREVIFLDDQDYFNFLKRLKIVLAITDVPKRGVRGFMWLKPLPKFSYEILSYCLMPNHFHILIKQTSDVPIGDLINKVCHSYVKYFNRKYNRVGNLFQDIFKAKLIDNDFYLTYLSAYIHNNPPSPLSYKYSSFNEYLPSRKDQITAIKFILSYFENRSTKYKKFVLGYNKQYADMVKEFIFEE